MSDTSHVNDRDLGPHQHAHVAPTSQQIRTVGQRRREAEEKLEHHLQEARHKKEHPSTTQEAAGRQIGTADADNTDDAATQV